MGPPYLQGLEAGWVLCRVLGKLSIIAHSQSLTHDWQKDGGSLGACRISSEDGEGHSSGLT